MVGRRLLRAVYIRLLAPTVHYLFFRELIGKTNNFLSTSWLGHPIFQNILDLWTIQETIALVRPGLLIECGTFRGGSSMFFANLFDLMGEGQVVTIDVERMHNLSHPRITYLIGSSTSEQVLAIVRRKAAACTGPVMVILDDDHSRDHVRRELECYAPLVTPGSYCLVQDGVIDTTSRFRSQQPGPLPAIKDFLRSSDDFEIDAARCETFLDYAPPEWLAAAEADNQAMQRTAGHCDVTFDFMKRFPMFLTLPLGPTYA